MDDAIWDNTNPCNASFDNMSGTKTLANIEGTKELIATTTTLTSSVYDKIWYSTHEECDLWFNVLETMDDYQEWDDQPKILEDTSPMQVNISNWIFILTIIKPKYKTFKANYFTVYHRIPYKTGATTIAQNVRLFQIFNKFFILQVIY